MKRGVSRRRGSKWVGLAAELQVAQDLVSRGYEVFAPLLGYPHSCDLIAVRDGTCLRVEVKKAHWEMNPAGGERVVGGLPAADKLHLFDVLARATSSGVVYVPDVVGSDEDEDGE